MKFAIIKIFSNINLSKDVSNSMNELFSAADMLIEGGAEVELFTYNNVKHNLFNLDYSVKNISYLFEHEHEYDALIIINGGINFFGGKLQTPQFLELFKLINYTKLPIILLLYDPQLIIAFNNKTLYIKEALISEYYSLDTILIPDNKINIITQCRDVNKLKKYCKFIPKEIKYFSLENFPLFMEKGNFTEVDFDNAKYDLNYAGSWRSGNRQNKLIHFFFGLPEDIKVKIFGNIKLEQFTKQDNLRAPEFGNVVPHNEVRNNILEGLSTVIIGDNLYAALDDIAQRAAESIIYGQLTFIDSDYDRTNRFYKNKELKDFLRIDNREQFIDKIRLVKKDKKMFYDLLKAQRDDLTKDFNPHQYCVDFLNSIKEML